MVYIFDILTYFYLCIIPIVFLVMIFKCHFINKNPNELTKYINVSFVFCFILIYVHLFLITTTNYSFALILYSLNFLFLDGIVASVFLYVKKYSKVGTKKTWFSLLIVFFFLIDAAIILSNPFTNLYLEIERSTFSIIQHQYWSLQIKQPMYFHYILCGITVLITVLLLFIKTQKVPSIYKIKYRRFMISYFIIVSLSYISNIFDLPQDLSVYFYGFITDIAFNFSLLRTNDVIKTETLNSIISDYPQATCWFDNTNSLCYVNNQAKELFANKKYKANKENKNNLHNSNISFSFLIENRMEFYNFKKINSRVIENFLLNFIRKNYARNLDMVVNDETLEIDNKKYLFEVTYKKLYSDNEYIGCYLNFRDKTEETQKYLQDIATANHDTLTGLYNRDYFFTVANEVLNDNYNKKWVMICSDIKNFKLLNDMLGQKIGDSILIQQAENLKNNVEHFAVFGRIVDDKFAILMEQSKFSEALIQENIIDVVKINENNFYYMKVLIGVYESTIVHENAKFMYDKALMAIDNWNPNSQKNFAYYSDTIMKKFLYDRNIVSDFDYAFSSGQFEMYLQPLINSSRKTIGAEALLRWAKPGSSVLSPENFLYIFEKHGLFFKLDLFIWEEAAKKLHKWQEEEKKSFYYNQEITTRPKDFFICINISFNDMYYVDIYSVLCNLVDKYKINPKSLKLEISEFFLSQDYAQTIELLNKLHDFGFDIIIDNFGEKYASLRMFKLIKTDYLKLNLQTLKQGTDKPRSKTILSNLINTAQSLGIEIIANRIESERHFDYFSSIGLNMFQGYYFAEPTPASQFDKQFLDNV
ncbi:MAG: bifunctional diguanylate cyclase/phosphodiesterase [Treponema sp.]|nr:bifunctional diguanylate cyclase/phosphodiesterase [Treponema sp.]